MSTDAGQPPVREGAVKRLQLRHSLPTLRFRESGQLFSHYRHTHTDTANTHHLLLPGSWLQARLFLLFLPSQVLVCGLQGYPAWRQWSGRSHRSQRAVWSLASALDRVLGSAVPQRWASWRASSHAHMGESYVGSRYSLQPGHALWREIWNHTGSVS